MMTWRSIIGVTVCASLLRASAAVVAPPSIGLSHVPIAVSDLSRAGSDFERLGFTLKDGRPHEDGIANRHAKFADGTEVELITAPAATDALTSYYRRFLDAGDGAAFLSLYPASMDDAERQLTDAGLPARRSGGYLDFPFDQPLGYVFLAGLNQSPTDRREHFAHGNSAISLEGVWLEGRSLESEQRLLAALGVPRRPCPDEANATSTCATLAGGQWLRLSHVQSASARRIVGLTVTVRSVASAAAVFDRERIGFRRSAGAGWSSVIVEGPIAHGVQLEFRQHLLKGSRR